MKVIILYSIVMHKHLYCKKQQLRYWYQTVSPQHYTNCLVLLTNLVAINMNTEFSLPS